ncbi:hypothetical protein CC86DRAFT_159044 [Ophiobolus disseminans]|uniref:REJ domain-containing protein n=1 Tax=Ophiobolus disseminans TaxID=1469910 RepID=A0A6A6ZB29_9PLEO|nr:hypothetical protein CC86DRAFT_159044 [Ophiobolus disseminans]
MRDALAPSTQHSSPYHITHGPVARTHSTVLTSSAPAAPNSVPPSWLRRWQQRPLQAAGWLSSSRDSSASIDPPARCSNVATVSTSMSPLTRIPSYRTSASGNTPTIAFLLTGKNSVLTQTLPRRASPSHPPT